MLDERPAWTAGRAPGHARPSAPPPPVRTDLPGLLRRRVGVGLAALASLVWTSVAVADGGEAGSLEADTAFVTGAPGIMETRLREVEALHDRAVRDGQPIRVSCIEQKQRQIRESIAASWEVVEGWSLAAGSPEFRERSLYRMQVLKQYSAANADAAHACTDGPAGTTRVRVEFVDPGYEPAPGSGSERAPTVERPPLASVY